MVRSSESRIGKRYICLDLYQLLRPFCVSAIRTLRCAGVSLASMEIVMVTIGILCSVDEVHDSCRVVTADIVPRIEIPHAGRGIVVEDNGGGFRPRWVIA